MTEGLRVCLMGVSYSTGNLGVSALAEGAIQGILGACPGARITIVSDGAREASKAKVEHGGREMEIDSLPIRYGKRVWSREHVLMMYAQATAARAFGAGRRFAERSPLFRALWGADIVADLSGGDSFTDIYGAWRMSLQSLFKGLVILMGKRLVLLPQTIGPFERAASRAAARFILRRAAQVYTRDADGVEEIRRTAGEEAARKARFAPDVGFLVEPKEPADGELAGLVKEKAASAVLVGINVSGLLASGGYTQRNQFGLKADYRRLHVRLAKALLAQPKVFVVFVPHVIRERGHVEDDVTACEAIRTELAEEERARTYIPGASSGDTAPTLGLREAKWVIGQCAFFVGSRMHSCIAALSQGVPAVGVAYSRKFRGVFETMGVGEMTVDLREQNEDEIVAAVMKEFERRRERRGDLAAAETRAKARAAFADVCGIAGG